MIKKNDITSTEKLLELIRNKKGEADDAEGAQRKLKKRFVSKGRLGGKRSLKKSIKIGIDINESNITLAAVTRVSEEKQKLIGIKSVPLGPEIKKGSPEFTGLLKNLIREMAGSAKKTALWATIPSADVETRFLRIPNVGVRQIPNAVRWAFQKETSINDTQIFDYQFIDTVYVDGEQKKEVLAYTAPRNDINDVRQLFSKTGYPLKGISIVPFAIQNLLRDGWLKNSGKTACTLFIGRDWSRITIFSKNVLVLSRDIKAGARSMVRAILEALDNRSTTGEDLRIGDSTEEELSIATAASSRNLKKAEKIFADFLEIRPSSESAPSDLKREKLILGMFKPALDRVIRQVEMTLEHFSLNFSKDTIDNVYISGELSSKRCIVAYIGKQLDLAVEQMDPFSRIPASKTRELLGGKPFTGDAFVPAAGMALSENETTPNFIFTYIQKGKKAFTRKFNQVAYAVFIVLILMSMGVFYYQAQMVQMIKADIEPLRMELEAYSPRLDRNLMAGVTGETARKMRTYSTAAGHYLPAAVVTELLEITPAAIKLTNVQAIMGTVSSQKIEDSGKLLTIEGVVSGSLKSLEREVTEYLVLLKQSPLFKKPTVKEKHVQKTEDGEVLKFVLSTVII